MPLRGKGNLLKTKKTTRESGKGGEGYLVVFVVVCGQIVCNTFVAIDAAIPRLLGFRVLLSGSVLLFFKIHGIKLVAITASGRVVILHCPPNMLGQFQTLRFKFFRCVYAANEFVIELAAGFNFTNNLWKPGLGYVTIRTNYAYAGAILIMNRLLIFLVNRLLHLVAGDAELEGVGVLHAQIEAAQ